MRLLSTVFLVTFLAVLLFPFPSHAKYATWEQLYGATNINAATGNGGLTAAFSSRGELTVLRWPNPSYYEHLSYLTSNEKDARRRLHFGALDSMGAFFGLVLKIDGQKQVIWLWEGNWTIKQKYLTTRSDVIETTFSDPELGLTLVTTAFVAAKDDLLFWQIRLVQSNNDDVKVLGGLFYENLTPSKIQIPYLPMGGWAFDIFAQDFAFFDGHSGSIVHVANGERFFDKLDPLLQSDLVSIDKVNDFIEDHVVSAPPNLMVGATMLDWDYLGVQIGEDSADNCALLENLLQNADWEMMGLSDFLGSLPVCLLDPMPATPTTRGWQHRPQSAWDDCADGQLSESPIAALQTNGAFFFDLNEGQSRTVILAAEKTLRRLHTKINQARQDGFDAALAANLGFWKKWTNGAILPDTDDQRIIDFSLRALISLKTAQDRTTGNIVASVANQPTYAYDWPRDSAFLNYALDLAGYYEEVTLHNLNYVDYQRKESLPLGLGPAGTYDTNFDAAGRSGGPILFEIDNTGLITWSYYEHYLWLVEAGDVEAKDYLEKVYPAIALAADFLAQCTDEQTGLQCFASEDDSLEKTQTVQGATAVYAALTAAAAAGEVLGEDPDITDAWAARAQELRDAALAHFWDEDQNRFTGSYKGERWTIFPSQLVTVDDPRTAMEAEYLLGWVEDELKGRSEVVHYTALSFLSLAWYFRQIDDQDGLAKMRQIIADFLHWVPSEDTLHLGEWSVLYDNDNDGFGETVVNEVCLPHVWNQALNYTAAILAFGGKPLLDSDNDDDGDGDDNQNDDDEKDNSNESNDDDEGCGC